MPIVYEAPAYELAAAQTSSQQYKKRADTSGFRAQFYETKLLSLLYFRAVHDDAIEEFLIATNIENIGAFDDICFKAKVKGQGKPVTVFIQTKHGKNKTQALKIDLATCFNSYIRIRQNFDRHTSKESLFFKGTFNEAECIFVIFTNASVDYGEAPAGSGLPAKIHDILDTGGIVKQPNSDYNVDYLIKQFLKYQVTTLTECIVRFIFDDRNYQVMLLNELVLRYHVLLAQKVLDVSDIQPLEHNDAKRYRIASFRQDFFDNNEEFIVHFRDALYSEVVKRRKIKPAETKLFLSELLGDPTDAARLSKLIGTVVTYKYGQLEFDKQSTKIFRPNMEPIDVSQSTVNRAVELAATEMLSRLTFKVPAAFGNKDLTFRGSDAKIERRIGHLAMKITDLLYKCEPSKIVTIDESLEDGFLQLNGGIAGAIGNIFVLDDNTKLMKITDNHETLGPLASSLYTSLKKNVHDLHEYKFSFIGDKFPKLSFGTGYEEAIVRDFLNRMLVYCNQADKKDVQEMLKTEVDDLQRNQPNYYQAKTDAILSKYYDEIQKWWMQPHQAPYLTEVINLFRRSIDNIIQDPLVSSINLTYRSSKLEQYDYTFTDDAVRSLNLPAQRPRAVIVAQNCVLTVLKVLQHLKNEDHAVLDLDYMASLPTNDLNALRAELIKTNMEKVLILVCEKIDSRNEMKILKNIAEAVKNKTSIVITNQKSLDIIHTYFPEPNTLIHDKKFSLTDVIQTSQKRIYESATVVLPGGVEIRVDHLLRGWPKAGLE